MNRIRSATDYVRREVGISVEDPIAFVGVLLLDAGIVMTASYLPARAAAALDPAEASRND